MRRMPVCPLQRVFGQFRYPTVDRENIELASVSCVDPTFCLAVGTYRPQAVWNNPQGEYPVVMRFDGQRWSKVRAPAPLNAELKGVDCLSRSQCVAVGVRFAAADGSSSPLVESLSGTRWSLQTLTGPAPFRVRRDATSGRVMCLRRPMHGRRLGQRHRLSPWGQSGYRARRTGVLGGMDGTATGAACPDIHELSTWVCRRSFQHLRSQLPDVGCARQVDASL